MNSIRELDLKYRRRSWFWHRHLRAPWPFLHWRDGTLLNSAERGVASNSGLYVGAAGRPRAPGFLSIDIVRTPDLHIVGNAEQLPFRSDVFDLVECPAVLEHVRDPTRAVAEFHRVLRPGGLLHIAVPFCHPYHGYPEDHHRWTKTGLRLLVGNFEVVDEGTLTGPTATLLTFILEYVRLWFPLRLAPYAYAMAGWVLWPMRYLDCILNRSSRASVLANTIWIHARKPCGDGTADDVFIS